MKCGMLDSIYDTFQAFTQHESPNTLPKNESIDVEPGENQKPVVPDADHSLQQTHSELSWLFSPMRLYRFIIACTAIVCLLFFPLPRGLELH